MYLLGLVAVASAAAWILIPMIAGAPCDTMDGPVVRTAKAALAKGNVTPVLKWVRKDDEAEIRAAFARTLAARKKGPDARSLADPYFSETLVRLHRAGEGAPYTGLKPAATELAPAVQAADRSLETGRVDAVVSEVEAAVDRGIRQRFASVREKKKHADDSVEAGREYVAACIEHIHFVERLYLDATSQAGHKGGAQARQPTAGHAG